MSCTDVARRPSPVARRTSWSCAARQSTTRDDARGNTRVRRKHEQYACSDDDEHDDDDDDDEARTRRHTLEGAYRAHARAGEG